MSAPLDRNCPSPTHSGNTCPGDEYCRLDGQKPGGWRGLSRKAQWARRQRLKKLQEEGCTLSSTGSLNQTTAGLIMLTISEEPMPTYKSQFGGGDPWWRAKPSDPGRKQGLACQALVLFIKKITGRLINDGNDSLVNR